VSCSPRSPRVPRGGGSVILIGTARGWERARGRCKPCRGVGQNNDPVRHDISCNTQVLPSGSVNGAYRTPWPLQSSMSPTATSRATSSVRAASKSFTTRCSPRWSQASCQSRGARCPARSSIRTWRCQLNAGILGLGRTSTSSTKPRWSSFVCTSRLTSDTPARSLVIRRSPPVLLLMRLSVPH